MKKLLHMDFKNIINSMNFRAISIIMISIPIICFLVNCKISYGLPIQFVRSSLEENFLNGTVSRHVKLWFILIFPLLSMMLCSDIYSIQYNNGIYKSIITRCSKKKYILSKIIVVFALTFSVIFISLFINQVLCIITFPLKGLDNAMALPAFDIGYFNYSDSRFLDLLRVQNTCLYNLVYMLIYSLVGALYAIIALSTSFFIKNSKVFIISIFIIYFGVYEFFITQGLEKFHLNSYLDGDSVGNGVFIAWIFVLVVIPFVFTAIKYKSKNEI
ncbi:hypothetical protein [Clostridium cibarium]|uniref:ABC-2 family transporter protein n=1 Tax=Clostridium cibarium TaxID=2762247 RepID=A0ABR8PXL4_9CLOT|nr:hypothetical protein [Clostridium cibarium]MBD7912904.1 hypothetical protein [Clostridium cibarium]